MKPVLVTEPHPAPFIEWPEFRAALAEGGRLPRWHQGEHVTAIGPTGCGKTTLLLDLVEIRAAVCIIGTKPTGGDDTLMPMIWRRSWRRPFDPPPPDAWRHVKAWPPPDDAHRVILWPTFRIMADKPKMAAAIRLALDEMFAEGGWCIFCDETNELVDTHGLGDTMKTLWRQGRSIGVSVVSALQRPRHAPLEAYDQATHLFIWRDNDDENRKRLGDFGGSIDRQSIRQMVAALGEHEVLYLNTRTGQAARTKWSP